MITASQMYWITRLDGIACALGFVFTTSVIVSFVVAIMYAVNRSDGDEENAGLCKKILFRVLAIGIFVGVVGTMIPSTKEMAAIILIPRISQNVELQKLPNNILGLANEWIEELKPKKESNEEETQS